MRKEMAMPAYAIARVAVHDEERYLEYLRAVPAIVERFGGRYLARGGETVTLSGPEETHRIVVIEFPSVARAKACFQSEEYRQAAQSREGAATGQLIVVEGA
jgi:uncharacterized protein (DUF1330 family)